MSVRESTEQFSWPGFFSLSTPAEFLGLGSAVEIHTPAHVAYPGLSLASLPMQSTLSPIRPVIPPI